MAIVRHVLLMFTFAGALFAMAPTSDAQTVHRPDIHPGSIEISLDVSETGPTVFRPPSNLRGPLVLTKLDDHFSFLWGHVSVRAYLTRRISASVQIGASTWDSKSFRLPLPPVGSFTFPTEQTLLQHRRDVAISQAVDLISGRQFVPWAGAGLLFETVSSRDVIDGFRFSDWARRVSTDRTAFAAAGLKVYGTPHAFVSVSGLFRLGNAPAEGFGGRFQVGGGIGF
jgi:hypothetical protein